MPCISNGKLIGPAILATSSMDGASATRKEAIGSTGESVDDEGDEDETKALVAEGVGRLSPTGLADGRSLLADMTW